MPRFTLFKRGPVTRRDDAALPHEPIPVPDVSAAGVQTGYDDGWDGNTTPNGGR